MSVPPSSVALKASHSPSGETVRSGATASPEVRERTEPSESSTT